VASWGPRHRHGTLAVDAHENRLVGGHVALDEGEVLDLVDRAAEGHARELAELRWHARLAHALHQPLVVAAVLDQFGDRREKQIVLAAELPQVRQAHHRAVVVLDLADHPDRLAARETCEVYRRLGVPGTLQDAPVAGAQGEDVTGAGECRMGDLWVGECAKRCCAVGCRDARGSALQ
jgi:hypothetical protein